MSRETTTTTKITCDFCNGTVYGEPATFHRIVLKYTPIEPAGIDIRFGEWGCGGTADICRDCAAKAMVKLLEEWGKK